jgi:TIR domain-containing protein
VDVGWDFFVSYTQKDRAWAEWIAWILEEDGHKVLVQAWDFVPGSNWTQSMQDGVTRATRTLAVLSGAYLTSVYGEAEWLAAWGQDPGGAQRKLLPVRVEDCDRPGLLGNVVGVDVFGREEAQAKAVLRQAVANAVKGRAKPATRPGFPGRAIPRQARFPGAMPTVWNVAAPNANFTGRDTELAKIETALSSGSTLTVHSLHGLGGIGKTQLAIEYAHTRAGNYDLVWSIAAEEPATIPDQFARLAKQLGADPAGDPDDLRDQVHGLLAGVAGWLLIFDNANEVNDIRPWLPSVPLPPGLPGHVVITTRRGGYLALGTVLDLDVIDTPAAVRVLRARVPSLDEDTAERIAEALGRLPLALEQAAAFLDRTAMPATDYLHILEKTPARVLAEGELPPTVKNIATVWNLSLDRIHAENPAALQLLDVISYLAPESIPVDLFTGHPDQLPSPLAEAAADPLTFAKTVGTLVDYSLVKSTPSGLQIHRLVQTAIRARHKETP